MTEESDHDETQMDVAAVCGLCCEACTVFIGTREEPERLRWVAARFQFPEEAVKCYGCRSKKRFPACETCKMSSCAAKRNIDFCSQCAAYPCGDLRDFQSQRPHRIELWQDLERIKTVGHEQWLKEMRGNYSCAKCGTINSAYDLKCRKCGQEPSCGYVDRHGKEIRAFLAKTWPRARTAKGSGNGSPCLSQNLHESVITIDEGGRRE